MTLQEKQKVLEENNCCFNCTKASHSYKKCRSKLKCAWCSREYAVIMCHEISTKNKILAMKSQPDANINTQYNLANFFSNPEVLLQTLRVKLRGETTDCEVRAIVDNGSQRSYIVKSASNKVGYNAVGYQVLTQVLFEVQSCAKIIEFPKFYVRHIGSAISKNGNPMSNS